MGFRNVEEHRGLRVGMAVVVREECARGSSQEKVIAEITVMEPGDGEPKTFHEPSHWISLKFTDGSQGTAFDIVAKLD